MAFSLKIEPTLTYYFFVNFLSKFHFFCVFYIEKCGFRGANNVSENFSIQELDRTSKIALQQWNLEQT
jgi:hypothetical protein